MSPFTPESDEINAMDSIDSYRKLIKINNDQLIYFCDVWKFVGGLLDSIIPPYKSGTLVGKNGWAFYFDSQGKPYGMAQNGGTPVDYGKGENWMNVYEVKLFNSVGDPLTDVPQIGATGAFATTGIDMARERITGANQISSTKDMLMRVLGGNDGKTVYWLYEGRLTSLTDSTAHHPEG